MADWTDIPDERLEPGKPIRSIEGIALRDNPQAIAEGAAGAPRILPGAIGEITASTDAGDSFLQKLENQVTDSADYIEAATFYIGQSGSVNVYYEHGRVPPGPGTVRTQILLNGSVQATNGNSGGYLAVNHTINDLVPGDVITIQYRAEGDPNNDGAQIREIRLRATGVVCPWGVR